MSDAGSGSSPHHERFDAKAASQEAADWLARRDRGLSAAEQDDYLEWLRADARHGTLITRHEATLRRMTRLSQWQPVLSSEPNADLFSRRRRAWWRMGSVLSAVAAAAVVGLFLWPPASDKASDAVRPALQKTFVRINDTRTLPDGSTIELRENSQVETAFSESERRVRLAGGEAFFTVAKDPSRPFVVEAGGIEVRALGTAFVVRLDFASVDVVVTEGVVQVEPPAPAAPLPATQVEASKVPASHRAVISRAADAPPPAITAVTADQIRDVLAWQAPRFQFDETPLSEAAAEFNRRNARQIVIADAQLAETPIGGTFRVDNVDGFISLLQMTLGVQAESRGEREIILTRGRP